MGPAEDSVKDIGITVTTVDAVSQLDQVKVQRFNDFLGFADKVFLGLRRALVRQWNPPRSVEILSDQLLQLVRSERFDEIGVGA